jgi:hypothetical protein
VVKKKENVKKNIKENVKKNVKENVVKKVDMKNLILNFLQDKPLELRRAVPNLIRVSYKENPDRIFLIVNSLIDPPVLKYDGVDIPVELKVINTSETIVMVDNENGEGLTPQSEEKKQEDDIYHREFSKDASKLLNIKESIGPHNVIEDPKKIDAFKAWQKRHAKVKIVKE